MPSPAPLRLFSDALLTRVAYRIMRALPEVEDSMSKSHIREAIRGQLRGADMDDALAQLQRLGWVWVAPYRSMFIRRPATWVHLTAPGWEECRAHQHPRQAPHPHPHP